MSQRRNSPTHPRNRESSPPNRSFLPLPQDSLWQENPEKVLCDLPSPNLALLMQKFATWKLNGGAAPGTTLSLSAEAKSYSCVRKQAAKNTILSGALASYEARLKACGGTYRTYTLRSRLVIGLGGADVREVGFTLHRHGFPYIPASSLKGLARAAAELIAKASEKEIHRVFGWSPDPAQQIEEGQVGKAVFWDAFPLPNQASLLELDVLNPHFPDYYRTEGTEPPSEWQSPIPIFFLAVPAGTKFIFCISGEEQEKAWDWLHTGLTEMGAGAKTTLGYGLWEKVSAASQIPLASKAAEKPLASQSPTSNTLSSPPKWKRTQSIRKGTSLYARILRPGPEKDELLVELWAEGYEGEEVLCKGIASHFTHAGFIEVEVSQPNPKLQVRFKRKL